MNISLPWLQRQTDRGAIQGWMRDRSIYSYPPRVRLLVNALGAGALAVSGVGYLLTWVRAVTCWLSIPPEVLPIKPFLPEWDILHFLLISHLSLFFAILGARAIAFLSPTIRMVGDELVLQSLFGTRSVRYRDVKGLVSMEIQSSSRFVVWVEAAHGLPLQNWLAILLFGRWCRRGFLVTSDLSGFDTVIGRIVEEMQAKYGESFSEHFAEVKPNFFMHMLLAPEATLTELARAESVELPLRDAAILAASAALSLALPLAVAELIHFELPWRTLLFLPLAFAEWPLASLYLATAPIGDARQMRPDEAMRVYPFTQLPRWLGAAGVMWLVIAGAPSAFVSLAILAVVALDCYWVLKLVKEWFLIQTLDGLLGIVVTAVYQLILFEFMFLLIPW